MRRQDSLGLVEAPRRSAVAQGPDELSSLHRRPTTDADLRSPFAQSGHGPVVVGARQTALSAYLCARGVGGGVGDASRLLPAGALVSHLLVQLVVADAGTVVLTRGHLGPPGPLDRADPASRSRPRRSTRGVAPSPVRAGVSVRREERGPAKDAGRENGEMDEHVLEVRHDGTSAQPRQDGDVLGVLALVALLGDLCAGDAGQPG